MTNTQEYNGWSNYETWLVNLWLDNDYGMNQLLAEQAADAITWDHPMNLATYVERAVDYIIYPLEREPGVTSAPSGLAADFVAACLRCVNWQEIAEGLLQTAREDAEPGGCPWHASDDTCHRCK